MASGNAGAQHRAALLDVVTHWPTYYPSELSAEEIVQEMLAH
ncbi:ZinT/AdcA family metal-binding protein [Cereibacter sphaeroides]